MIDEITTQNLALKENTFGLKDYAQLPSDLQHRVDRADRILAIRANVASYSRFDQTANGPLELLFLKIQVVFVERWRS